MQSSVNEMPGGEGKKFDSAGLSSLESIGSLGSILSSGSTRSSASKLSRALLAETGSVDMVSLAGCDTVLMSIVEIIGRRCNVNRTDRMLLTRCFSSSSFFVLNGVCCFFSAVWLSFFCFFYFVDESYPSRFQGSDESI